jgi:hypothetical protein
VVVVEEIYADPGDTGGAGGTGGGGMEHVKAKLEIMVH